MLNCWPKLSPPHSISSTVSPLNRFNKLQQTQRRFIPTGCISEKLIASGHDVSDGGLIVTLLEMSFAGVCGFWVDLPTDAGVVWGDDPLTALFSEELGLILEVEPEHESSVLEYYQQQFQVPCVKIGQTLQSGSQAEIRVDFNGVQVFQGCRSDYLRMWEETSYQLDRLQADARCVSDEFQDLVQRTGPNYRLTFDPDAVSPRPREPRPMPRVAVLREEGTNGDREMATALMASGFQVWDINTQDLLDGDVSLDPFKGLVFPGGFSFGGNS